MAGADLGWDLHSHLVPGVDDGIQTVDEAIEVIIARRAWIVSSAYF